jgi:hypothetical protein
MFKIDKSGKRVSVVVSYKASGDSTKICMPHKMLLDGKEVKFSELGLRHPTTKGGRLNHIFDMTDGINDYRLEFDAERLTWTLTETIAIT